MLQVAGIIAEYNPFHNGHAYHIEKTRASGATHIVAVMSGNFVQRGDAAILPKAARVEQALAGGADLVLELPAPFAMARAETFADGAIQILHALGCVQTLSFGSECGDIAQIEKAAEAVETEAVSLIMKQLLQSGMPFAMARQNAVAQNGLPDAAQLLENPNNILGVEYLKALKRQKSSIRPIAVLRTGAAHDSEDTAGFFASASEIRRMVLNGEFDAARKFMPQSSVDIIRNAMAHGQCPVDIKACELAVLAVLRSLPESAFEALPDISEGLENRLLGAIRQSGSLEEILFRVKSKRYPLARIRRLVLSAYLGLTQEMAEQSIPYIRVLGLNENGKEILRMARETAKLPIVMRTADITDLHTHAKDLFELESHVTDLYTLGFQKHPPCGLEKTQNVILHTS